ncbi:uncharacterized protein A4U43_C04F27090 [Asparagus officinalis]|uniref:Uncharacterized protein n=1 Tax=Asparagus officinalis TaxID=4686 RepID=A0A5P1F997_ASPOF|nr:uncharacterized protein A4U43_C04F27090 [Asparagus officinalis]
MRGTEDLGFFEEHLGKEESVVEVNREVVELRAWVKKQGLEGFAMHVAAESRRRLRQYRSWEGTEEQGRGGKIAALRNLEIKILLLGRLMIPDYNLRTQSLFRANTLNCLTFDTVLLQILIESVQLVASRPGGR